MVHAAKLVQFNGTTTDWPEIVISSFHFIL